jgi:iron(III) transport system permease protein
MKAVTLGGGVVVLLVVVGLPLVWLLVGSFRGPEGPTLEFYRAVFTAADTYAVLGNTLGIGAAVALLSVLLGVPMAWLVSRSDMPGRQGVWTFVNVAYATPPFLTAIAYVMLLGPNAGLINRGLRAALGLAEPPFDIFSVAGLVFVITLHVFPFVFLLVAGSLESLDPALEQSARILGAGRLRTLGWVTLPMVRPAILAGGLLAFVDSLSLFGPQAILGVPARIHTVPTRIYSLFSYPPRFGLASALAMSLVVVTAASLYLQHRFLGRRSYVTMTGKGAPVERVGLGAWRWPALAGCGAVFLAAVVFPYGVLLGVSFSRQWATVLESGSLTLRNYAYVLFEFSLTRHSIVNSLWLAAGAATLAMAVGLLVAYLDLRTAFVGRRALDYLSVVPLGLPGIVLSVGLIQAWIRPPLVLYGTAWILLIAYVARFVPFAVRSANTSLRQVDPALEEAARISGAAWLRSVLAVTVPLVKRGLFSGWLLIFVPALRELSASVLLFTSGTETLAVSIFTLYEEGYFEAVCALAVVTLAITLGVLALARRVAGPSVWELPTPTRVAV